MNEALKPCECGSDNAVIEVADCAPPCWVRAKCMQCGLTVFTHELGDEWTGDVDEMKDLTIKMWNKRADSE